MAALIAAHFDTVGGFCPGSGNPFFIAARRRRRCPVCRRLVKPGYRVARTSVNDLPFKPAGADEPPRPAPAGAPGP